MKIQKYGARIIINNTNNDGEYTSDFLRLMWTMGAELTIEYNGCQHEINSFDDFQSFIDNTK